MLKLKLRIKKPLAKPNLEMASSNIKNPYIEEVKRMNKELLVDIWKVGFIKLKNKLLLGENITRYAAVKTILEIKHGISLPKDDLKKLL